MLPSVSWIAAMKQTGVLRDNGIHACVDESTGGSWYRVADSARASDVLFACVCLRASISYSIEAAYWCMKATRCVR
jgi:hypothetical protein